MRNDKRTREELLNPDYNYYIFFRIEPNEKDADKIEKAILLEKNKWTQGQPIQRRYKELYPDVESVMIKDEGGARETERAAAREFRLERARRVCALLAKRGSVRVSELACIVRADKQAWLSLDDVRACVQGSTVRDDRQDVFDFHRYAEIERDLVTVRADSLADVMRVVSLAGNAPGQRPVNPVTKAQDRLAAHAAVIYGSPAGGKAYDTYLATKAAVWDAMALKCTMGVRKLSMSEYRIYRNSLVSTLHISSDEADKLLLAGMRHYRLVKDMSLGYSASTRTPEADARAVLVNLEKRGFVTETELKKLSSSLRSAEHTPDALKSLLRPGVWVDDTMSLLNLRTYRDVTNASVIANRDTLYAAIGARPEDSVSVLQDRIQVAFTTLRQHEISAETAAMDKLIGIAKNVFRSDESKRLYDMYTATRALVWDELELRHSVGLSEITLSEYRNYLQSIRTTLSVDQEEATLLLLAGLKEYTVTVACDM